VGVGTWVRWGLGRGVLRDKGGGGNEGRVRRSEE